MASSTGDFATFQARLAEMMEELPPPNAVQAVHRSTVFSRLLGRLMGQL